MKLRNIIFSGFLSLFLIACGGGGGGSFSSALSDITGGIVSDPYIQNATFFWDKDQDGIQDADEPISSASDINGKFTFSVIIPDGERIVMLNKGEHNGISYSGTLSANLSSSGVVSPLTTLEVEYPNTDIVTMLQNAGITIGSEDIHKDPMENPTVDHMTASIAADSFLKINNFTNVDKNSSTLSDIISVTKKLLDNNITTENIQNTVSISDYMTAQIKTDGNLDELTQLDTNSTYITSAKNTLQNRADKTKAGKLSMTNGSFNSAVAKTDSQILDNLAFSFSKSPIKDEVSTLSINLDSISSSSEITWLVQIQPTGSNMTLTVAADKKSVNFTPTVAGNYKISIEISNDSSSSSQSIPFKVKEIFALNSSNVKGIGANEGVVNDNTLGPVSNQSWVYSKSLDETQLTTLISNYSTLAKVGYDKIKGLLIEYTPTNSVAKEDIEKLKFETGIDKVYNRVYEGKNAFSTGVIYPEDNGAFNDGGTNWHLEVINMPEAWEYTTGSDEFLLGVSDGGFDTLHQDLSGRFASILTSAQSSHGMAVTGAMAANTNNNIGISGINWQTQVVASYMGGQYVEDVITTTKDGKEVKLINNSWGYHLPSDFDPTNATMAIQRFNDLQNAYAQIRQLVKYYDNKLFFWAAGNGVGNGYSTTGYYGVDAKYDNGVLHYENSIIKKLDNLLVVGAFIEDKKLVYYSEYGESVDIAAPTGFNSLALNNGIYTSFNGTSAASPTATAVASLIYSINPKLKASEVKNILITSATEYITQRYTNPAGNVEYLAHPIPILNAQEALKMAQSTIEKKIEIQSEITDIFTPTLQLTYSSFDSLYKVRSISCTVSSSSSEDNFTAFNTNSSSTNIIDITLDPNKRYHIIEASLELELVATGETFTQEHIYKFSYSDINIASTDNISLDPIGNVNITISKIDSTIPAVSGQTDNSGFLKAYLTAGDYRITGSKAGYITAAKDIKLNQDISQNINIALTSDAIPKVGSISGKVTDENGYAINGAIVSISGGEITNGYFASATTNEDGYYKITSIGKDFNGVDILDFNMSATFGGYTKVIRENVIVLEGKERTENFTLIKESNINIIYEDNFDGAVSDWTATGMWHQQDFNTTSLINVNIAQGNVELAPDDDTNGRLPNAYSGTKAFWYGQASTGNYIGTEDITYGYYDGGLSTTYNTGKLISKSISIGDVDATLKFSTWWEVEGQDPSKDFDFMWIWIKATDGSAVRYKLNPKVDAKLNPRTKKAYSTAGFNRKPIWIEKEIDLSAFAGKTITVEFEFHSLDRLYNGFRGWIIDDFRVSY
ncbi:MAG: S8 family serine peptidase [Arcobacteraceae bacterium]|nr:S8 family serine peptidase [Arcobacteraceae bacterium]